jgi:hypothetical protein
LLKKGVVERKPGKPSLTAKALAAPVAPVPGRPVPPGKRTVIEKKTQVEQKLSEDAKSHMADLGTQISNLATALRDFKVNLYLSGDIENYVKARERQARLNVIRRGRTTLRPGGA